MKPDVEEILWGRIVPVLNRCKRPKYIVVIVAVILSVIAIVRTFT